MRRCRQLNRRGRKKSTCKDAARGKEAELGALLRDVLEPGKGGAIKRL